MPEFRVQQAIKKQKKKERFEKLSDITMKTWSKRIEDLSTNANYCTYRQRKLTLEVTVFSRRKEKYANDYMKWVAHLKLIPIF